MPRSPEAARIAARKWREENRERHRAYSRDWNAKNPGVVAARSRVWYAQNKKRHAASTKTWYAKNPGYALEPNALNRGHGRKAMPAWANRFFMREAYRLAALRTKIFGFKWEVDHVVPLRSPLVCGLHCHTNIRVIPKVENRAKGNKVWPDMPGESHARI